jgi:hypothetical protein
MRSLNDLRNVGHQSAPVISSTGSETLAGTLSPRRHATNSLSYKDELSELQKCLSDRVYPSELNVHFTFPKDHPSTATGLASAQTVP